MAEARIQQIVVGMRTMLEFLLILFLFDFKG